MTRPRLAFPLWGLAIVAMVATVAAMMPVQHDFAAPAPTMVKPGSLSPQQWQPWRDRFMTADGRIVDDANSNISHSEGQGYGLLLAALAQDRAALDRKSTR